MSGKKHAMPTGWVDPDDAPELTDEFFEQADEFAQLLIDRAMLMNVH